MSVDANGEPVEGGCDSGWQLRLEIRVTVVVSQMRQVRALGAQLSRDAHRFRDAEMGWMLRAKQRVDDEHTRAAHLRHRVGGDTLRVGDVREWPETVAIDRERP